ncbi:hypothetical protein PM082_004137 [Marasmius tenuissimus]|nr:hypothetical protein PM082_004137 [Marasmius tenuissimus]
MPSYRKRKIVSDPFSLYDSLDDNAHYTALIIHRSIKRCDGKRPSCTPCQTSVQFNDCEYTDAGTTQSQMLEERIALLKGRVAELEARPPSSLTSHHASSTCGLGQVYGSSRNGLENSLTGDVRRRLLQKFFHHTAELPFFLDVNHFIATVAPDSDPDREGATNALLSTIYLWGSHFSRHHNDELVCAALQGVSQCSLGVYSGGTSVIHLIQASILLSHYLFQNSRNLEGKYQMTKALSLATAARLHIIRSAESAGPGRPPSPPNTIEEAEQIRAFWSVVIMNTCWTAVDRSPSNMVYTNEPGLRIDTPWPEDTDRNGFPRTLTGSYTIQHFLAGTNENEGGHQSWMTLHAKASILFERSTHVGSTHWNNVITRSPQSQRSNTEFFSLNSSIQSVSRRLELKYHNSGSQSNSRYAVISMLLDAACIRLHEKFVIQQTQSRQMAVSSARNIVRTVGMVASVSVSGSVVVVDPVVAHLAMISFQFLVEEYSRLVGTTTSSEVEGEMKRLLNGMVSLSSGCPLMKNQATEAHRTLVNLGVSFK